MSTPVAAHPPVNVSAGPSASKWIWLAVAIVVGLILAFSPTPQGLTRMGQLVLAITAGTVILWATEVMNNGVASVLMMALLIAVKVPPPRALSGFADPAFWTLLAVLYYGFAMRKTGYYGFAMRKTGLAERLSYYILTLFPGTYAGILTAFFAIGFVLALGIPSMTVRTAIMAPIAWAMVQTLGLAPRSKGSALIMLTVVEMAVVPGLAFELGSLNGPVVLKMFADKHLPITWTGYAQVMTVPTLIFCGLILLLNQLFLKPEVPLKASTDFARTKLAALGSVKRPEMITAIVVVVSIFLWATNGKLHSFPTFAVGMVAMAVFALSGILQDGDVATGVSWTLLLFLGGIFGLGNVIVDTKVTAPADRGLIRHAGLAIPGSHGLYRYAAALSAAGGTASQGGNSSAGADRAAAAGVGPVLADLHEFLDGDGRQHYRKARFQQGAAIQCREHLRALGDAGADRGRVLLAHDRRVLNFTGASSDRSVPGPRPTSRCR